MITKKINHLVGPQLINIHELEMSFYQRVGTFTYSRELKSKLYQKTKKKSRHKYLCSHYNHVILKANLLTSSVSSLFYWVGPGLDDLLY